VGRQGGEASTPSVDVTADRAPDMPFGPRPDEAGDERAVDEQPPRPPVRYTLVDVDTQKPVADAHLTVGERELVSDAKGVVDIPMRFFGSAPVTILHPRYIRHRGTLSDAGGEIALRAKSAATYAEIVATGGAQTVRVGPVTIAIPEGALAAGMRLDVGLLDPRTIPSAEYDLEPGEPVPLAIGQLVVDVVGHDGRRFAHVVTPGKPLHVSWKMKPRDLLELAMLDPEVSFSAGNHVERLPAGSLRFDGKKSELSFDVRHFSDMTTSQHAGLVTDKNGNPTELHWWRVSEKKQDERRQPEPGYAPCAPEARSFSISTTDAETTNISGSYATSWKFGTKAEVGVSESVTAKVIGNGGKLTYGVTAAWTQEYTRTKTGGFAGQTANRISITRSRTCPGGVTCTGWLYVDFERSVIDIVHRWYLVSDLDKDPEWKKMEKALQDSMPVSAIAQNNLEYYNETTAAGHTKKLADILNNNPNATPGGPMAKVTHEETFHSDVRRFRGAYMISESGPPTCGPDGGGGEGGAPPSGSGVSPGTTPAPPALPPTFSPPAKPVPPCIVPHSRRPPPVVPEPKKDPLVRPPGTVAGDDTRTVEGATIEIKITAGETRVVSAGMEEVAFAVACCPDQEDKVGFQSEVMLSITAAQQGAHNSGVAFGGKVSAEGTGGVNILDIAEATLSVKVDMAFQAGLTLGWTNAVQQAFGRTVGVSKEITAKATRTDCVTKGIYAYLYETDYTFDVVVHGNVWNSSLSFPGTLRFYGTPIEGPPAWYRGHCVEEKHTGMSSATFDTPTPPPPPKTTELPASPKTTTPSTPAAPARPVEKPPHKLDAPDKPKQFAVGLGLGDAGEIGSGSQSLLAAQIDGAVRILPGGELWGVLAPGIYHASGANIFVLPAGVEGQLAIGGVAPNITLYARGTGGYAVTSSSAGGSTSAGLLQPELGARYRAGDVAYVGVTPASIPIFFGPTTTAAYRLMVSGGALF
jgi:hypothetical protein